MSENLINGVDIPVMNHLNGLRSNSIPQRTIPSKSTLNLTDRLFPTIPEKLAPYNQSLFEKTKTYEVLQYFISKPNQILESIGSTRSAYTVCPQHIFKAKLKSINYYKH